MENDHKYSMPEKGVNRENLINELEEARSSDVGWKDGRSFGLVYHAGDEVDEIIREAYTRYIHSNALDPRAFPSLKKFETEVVSATANLLHADENAVGSVTSGGSESLMMAVKSARDQACTERPEVGEPEMIIPTSAHPALDKSAHYLGVKVVRISLDEEYRADLNAVRQAINPNTILLVASAPAYPHGVVDPIEEMGALAVENNIDLHVDACLGGYMLPFMERLGYRIPLFDFRVTGVTSISADLHKYGFTAKGASVIVYRSPEPRRYQFFVMTEWPGGLFGSSTVTGTRPGGAIAAAWAVMNYLGMEGYKRLAGEIMDTTLTIRKGIEDTGKLKILGQPVMSVFAAGSDQLDVYSLADAMAEKGWQLGRQQLPPALHFIITPVHTGVKEIFLADLKESITRVEATDPEACEGIAAMYAMMGAVCHQSDLYQFTLDYLDRTYRR